MSLDEESLEMVANGGTMDYEKWPSMVEPLLERLEYVRKPPYHVNNHLPTNGPRMQIIYNVFPMPRIPPDLQHQPGNPTVPTTTPSTSLQPSTQPELSSQQSSATERIPDSQLQSSQGSSLPEPLQHHLNSVKSTLRSLFASKPPHTIQRLAELIVRPTAHYRTLPAYLRAVDRVVCVTSNAEIFPLHSTHHGAAPQPNGAVINGADTGLLFPDHALGSDESLGGALLTPIPWLSNDPSSPEHEGESGTLMGDTGFPTQVVENTGAEQGHQQLGSVPSTAETATVVTADTNGNEGASEPPSAEALEDIPHARGPSVVGVEDLGLQDGRGVEMDLSSGGDGAPELQAAGQEGSQQQPQPQPQQEQEQQTTGQGEEEEGTKPTADGDGDISLDDVRAPEENVSVSETVNQDQQQA
ncbi:hypothetical protein ASPBRDRAFT_193412 [Aspergillus brasiliensis CBS 101740]|uniref:Protein phosphatase 4 core regulatory subunit R2 n=1 Tax=Aspergillus brasiliensis (strain CBS 101740 / IMI 381727 / IBT 21946) TaxID=767769 RepID=A0A1L9USX9_ASPBC|nr:hypothetical protein ASPBRDRAFT_193412 [Aspergillus brasiliensis CBS 101740]